MKFLGLIATALVGAALASTPFVGGPENPTPSRAAVAPERPLVFVPGLLGSRLCRKGADGGEEVVWGTLDAIGQFPALALSPEGNDLEPCGLIHEISFLGVLTQTIYGPFVDRLEQSGYREGETLFVFDYDWRLSVLDNAERLGAFIENDLPAGRIDIVAHSMGGLIARTYAMKHGSENRIARLVNAGSPWLGSAQTYELLQEGWGLANVMFGGIEAFRSTAVSFPSTFELLPRYAGCCVADFESGNSEAWAGLGWGGITAGVLPDLSEVGSRHAELNEIAAGPLTRGIEEAFVVGVDQRTPESFTLDQAAGEARFAFETSWAGDGTVLQESATLADRTIYRTSFATHDALLNDALVQDFVLASLRLGPAAAMKAVPVRERTSILSELGNVVELVGVAISTDQPAYAPAASGMITVHLRLGADEPVDPNAIRLTVTLSDGTSRVLVPVADPARQEPANPLEQSFSAQFATGAAPGQLTIEALLEASIGEKRSATRVIPVVAP